MVYYHDTRKYMILASIDIVIKDRFVSGRQAKGVSVSVAAAQVAAAVAQRSAAWEATAPFTPRS